MAKKQIKDLELTSDKEVTFKNTKYNVVYAQYQNGGTAILLFDAKTHEREITATVWVDETPACRPDKVFIKNYSENEGVREALVEAGILEYHTTTPQGFTTIDFCGIVDDKFLKELEKYEY